MFKPKPRFTLSSGQSCTLRRPGTTHCSSNEHFCSQQGKIQKLQVSLNIEDAISTRANLQYIATATRPELLSFTQLLSASLMHRKDKGNSQQSLRTTQKMGKYVRTTKTHGPKYVILDLELSRTVLFYWRFVCKYIGSIITDSVHYRCDG